MRLFLILAVCGAALAHRGIAQAPATGPLALLLPASTRAMGLGNAGVSGRDDDVVFYNPAQLIGARGGFNTSLARYGSSATLGAMSSVFTGGPLILGWGVQLVNWSARESESYPFAPPLLAERGNVNAFSMLATVGAAMSYKGFRIGTAAKYAEDRISAGNGVTTAAPALHGVFLGDLGVAHPLWNGVVGLSVQNIGRHERRGSASVKVPLQASLGWSAGKQMGELDVGVAAQLTARSGWLSPGGGFEVGYGWIEGYAVTLRAGARRPETGAEKPFTAGASFNADRFSMDYGLQFFDGGHTANRLTFRWR